MKKNLLARLWAVRTMLSNRGQGITEYILVLVVIVLVMLGLIYQLNTAFGSFLNNYFGQYLECLIETGELPSLGGDGITQGECDALFKPFDLRDGRKLIEASDNKFESSTRDASGSGSGESGEGARSGGQSFSRYGGGGTSNAESNSASSRPGTQSLNLAGGGGQNGRAEASSAGGSSDDSGDGVGGQSRRIVRRKNIIPGYLVAGSKSPKSAAEIKLPLKKKQTFENLRLAQIKFRPTDERKGTKQQDPDAGLNFEFSNIIKWMIILGILAALIIFLGGQIVQIRKSLEKGE